MTDELMLREYLRRQISEKIKILADICVESGREPKNFFMQINDNFSGNNWGNYLFKKSLIKDLAKSKGKYALYNYFNLDTLVAYNAYLDYAVNLLKELEFSKDLKKTKFMWFFDKIKFWKLNAGYSEPTYRSSLSPADVMVNLDGSFAPEKTLSRDDFYKKYNKFDCESEMDKYMQQKGIVAKKYEEFEHEVLQYNGDKYLVTKKENYFNQHFSPVYYIKAVNQDSELVGYFDSDYSVYYGDVYNQDGEIYCEAEVAGVDVYKKKTTKISSSAIDGM